MLYIEDHDFKKRRNSSKKTLKKRCNKSFNGVKKMGEMKMAEGCTWVDARLKSPVSSLQNPDVQEEEKLSSGLQEMWRIYSLESICLPY